MQSIDNPDFTPLRRLFTKAMKAYGPGIPHLESIMQETIPEVVDAIQDREGQPIDTAELNNGFVCCIMASLVSHYNLLRYASTYVHALEKPSHI